MFLVVVNDANPSIQINGCIVPEVVPASPQNSYTSYIHVLDPDDNVKNTGKRPLRTVLKSLSADSEDTSTPSAAVGVKFTPDSEKENKLHEEEYGRPSRLRRFADKFTRSRKNRQNGPRRRQSLPPKRLDFMATSVFCLPVAVEYYLKLTRLCI